MKRSALLFALMVLSTPIVADQAPSRPKITGIAEVFVGEENLKQLTDFYSNILHFYMAGTVGNCLTPKTCMIVNDRQRIDIAEAEYASPNSELQMIVFETSDLKQLSSYLASRGVSVSSVPTIMGASAIRMKDPEGHSIGFLQRSLVNNFSPRQGQVSEHLIHAGIVVHDRGAEDKFYKDILGFHVYWHGGMKEGEDHWVDMQVPDGTDWLEYMLKVPADANKHTLGVMNHIALGVPDIQAAEKQLRANGWTGAEEPKIGRDGKWQLNLYDPDDTRVELMEFTPTQKPCCSEYTGPHPGPESPSKASAKP